MDFGLRGQVMNAYWKRFETVPFDDETSRCTLVNCAARNDCWRPSQIVIGMSSSWSRFARCFTDVTNSRIDWRNVAEIWSMAWKRRRRIRTDWRSSEVTSSFGASLIEEENDDQNGADAGTNVSDDNDVDLQTCSLLYWEWVRSLRMYLPLSCQFDWWVQRFCILFRWTRHRICRSGGSESTMSHWCRSSSVVRVSERKWDCPRFDLDERRSKSSPTKRTKDLERPDWSNM